MIKKIKITERQKEVLANFERLSESSDHELIIKKIVDDLNLNYEPSIGTYRDGGEYYEKPIIKIKADGEVIRPKDLFAYMQFKNKAIGGEFLKQVILDWLNGDLNEYSLTKNVKVR